MVARVIQGARYGALPDQKIEIEKYSDLFSWSGVILSSQRLFTLDELKQYDGKHGRPAYIAYKGNVYDVSDDFLWVEGDHQYEHTAGKDLTEDLSRAPHGEDVLERPPIKIVGVLSK